VSQLNRPFTSWAALINQLKDVLVTSDIAQLEFFLRNKGCKGCSLIRSAVSGLYSECRPVLYHTNTINKLDSINKIDVTIQFHRGTWAFMNKAP
jgi:hypothetical protein